MTERKKPGRKPFAPGVAKTARLEVRLQPQQKAQVMALGGSAWVQDLITAYLPPGSVKQKRT